MLEQCYSHSNQCRNNVATLCCTLLLLFFGYYFIGKEAVFYILEEVKLKCIGANETPKLRYIFFQFAKTFTVATGGSVLGRQLCGALARQDTLERFVKRRGKVSIMKI